MSTDGEKRVAIYSEVCPTAPGEVGPDTPLESLNLNWRERDLGERERTKHVHRLHPYLGKFIPQLVEVFLRKYFKRGQTILDPFVGSGTTLVQANELGINAIGYDVSAFNVLLSRVKTARYDVAKVRREVFDILGKVRASTRRHGRQLSFWETGTGVTSVPTTDSEYLLEWYAYQSLTELLTYCQLIESGDYEYKDLLKIILSRSARSARLTTHYDLDFPKEPQREPYWCYKHSRVCRPTQEAFKFIRRYSLDTVRRIEEFATIRTDATVEVHHADSRQADFPPIDGIITSPPYVGLIDYHEQHKYAYELLGLEDKSDHEIGPAAQGSGERAREEYQEGLAEVFRRAVNSMPSGGRIIIVARDRHHLFGEVANRVGVDVEGEVKRHVNRRTGRRASEFFESVFIWRKS